MMRCPASTVAIVLALAVATVLPACRRQAVRPPAQSDAVNETLAGLVQALGSEDEDERARAMAGLAALGPLGAGALSTALDDPDEEVRLGVVEVLKGTPGPAAVDLLLGALDDPSEEVRLEAVEALGEKADRRAVQPLMRQYRRDEDDQVRYECLTSLGAIGDPAASDFLVEETRSDDPYARMWAMDALCTMGDPEAPRLALALGSDAHRYVKRQVLMSCAAALNNTAGNAMLIRMAIDGDEEFENTVWARRLLTAYLPRNPRLEDDIRSAAAAALGHGGDTTYRAAFLLAELGDTRALDGLTGALSHPSHLVRHHAAFLLGNIPDRRAVPPLIRALGDENALVGATAYDSLLVFAEDTRAQEAVRKYTGPKLDQRLER